MLLVPAHGPEYPLPPFSAESLVYTWSFEPGVVVPLIVALGLYLEGVRRLRGRGDPWPTGRGVSWVGGLTVVLIATSSALGTYDDTLFWVHSVQHMLLQMIAPVFLVLAAPMTLALRTLPRAPRRVLLAVTHSRPARFVAHPAVAFAIFALTQFLLYYTPLYEATLRLGWLHNLSHVHFVAVGFLFYWALLAIDPVPHRPMFPLKFGLVVGMAPMHVLLGLPIMMSERLFAGDYYLELARTWGPTQITDQNIGGAVLWAFGDVSSIVLIGAFLSAWWRSDQREARRTDRALDRVYGNAPTITPPWLSSPRASALPGVSRAATRRCRRRAARVMNATDRGGGGDPPREGNDRFRSAETGRVRSVERRRYRFQLVANLGFALVWVLVAVLSGSWIFLVLAVGCSALAAVAGGCLIVLRRRDRPGPETAPADPPD